MWPLTRMRMGKTQLRFPGGKYNINYFLGEYPNVVSLFNLHNFEPMVRFSVNHPPEIPTTTGATISNTKNPEAMQEFLESIHLKHKLKSDGFVKTVFKQKNEKSLRQHRQQTNQILQRAANFGVFEKHHQESARQNSQNLDVDHIVETLQTNGGGGTERTVKYLITSASVLAQNGLPDQIRLCQKIMSEHHDAAFHENLQLNHYLANALWNAKEYQKSMELFREIFNDYPGQRRKIGNLLRFCMIRAVQEYPCPEQMDLLLGFVEGCSKLKEDMPALHLWQTLFQHTVPAANEEAYKLLLRYPNLPKIVLVKFPSLLNNAREKESSSILFRMLQLIKDLNAPEKDINHYTGCIFDALMQIYCSNEDLTGATNIFTLASKDAAVRKDRVWPQTAQKLFSLLSVFKSEIPPEVLNAKHNQGSALNPFKLRF